MKRVIYIFIVVSLLTTYWGVPDAKINPLKKDRLISLADDRNQIQRAPAFNDSFFTDLHIGALWFPAISNKGYVGYYDISAYYPGGGDQSNVWQAGMWAGGYVGGNPFAWRFLGSDGHHSDTFQYDTLDEQAVLETEADFGLPYPYRRLTVHVNTAAKDSTISGGNVVDADMGLDVKYEWHQWGVPGYDHWVFIHFTIAFSKVIEDFWWGWMSDCDVGDVNVPDVYFDDFAGWDDTYEFCYMTDWDFDPLPNQPAAETTEDSLFLSPNAVGQILLAAPSVAGGDINAPPDNAQRWISKNYWDWNNDVSSVQNQYDRLTGDWENPFPPEDEFDYRILNGVGPYDVVPGDTAHFWMAYVIGEGYDDDSRATFGLGTLVEHVEDAHDFYNSGMAIPPEAIPPQAPDLDPDLDADVVADELTVHWTGYTDIPGGAVADSFTVYTSTISKLGPWEAVAGFDNTVTETTVKLTPGFYTYVWVEAYDLDNEVASNAYALSSRLYETDEDGFLRANENTITSVIGNTATETNLNKITVAPNPYVGTNEAELEEYETLLGFHRLPNKCTIYIYNLLGNLVDIIHHDSQSGSEYWDMTTRSGESISAGIYVYRVKAENGEEELGKFAVIKGQR
jgi:hypothetical protein